MIAASISFVLSASMTIMVWHYMKPLTICIAERATVSFLMSSPFWVLTLAVAAEASR